MTPDHQAQARAFLARRGWVFCLDDRACEGDAEACGCVADVSALAELLAEVAGAAAAKAESERGEEWRRRRDAEGSRDTAKAVAATARGELAQAEAALREIAALSAGELSLGDQVFVVTRARGVLRDFAAERGRLNVR